MAAAHNSRIFISVARSFWALVALFLACALPAVAQELGFATPLPSSQLLGGNVGIVTVNVLNTNGEVLTNSSAPVIVTITGPDNLSVSGTNNATNGTALFDFTSTALSHAGLYNLAATGSGFVPAFQNIGVEVAMLPPQGSIFAGAWVNPSTGPANISALEGACGRTLALSLHYYGWADSDFTPPQNFVAELANDAASNRIPVVSWDATNLTEILSGSQDAAITNAALAMASWQGPILLRWAWEMNLAGVNGKAWAYLGYPTNGDNPSPAQVAAAQTNFAAAWQRIRRIFDANSAANVIWLWNPGGGNDSAPGSSANGYTDGFYPGDAYVDWVGLDAYDRDDNTFFHTFTSEPAYGYTNMAAHAKPLLIGETGAYYTNEAHQISYFDEGAGTLQTNLPELLGCIYFDASGNDDWSLTIQGAINGLTEFSNLVNNPYLGAATPHLLNYVQYHSFSARVHIAAPAMSFQGGVFTVGVSVDNLYSNTPTGTAAIYCDTNLAGRFMLGGGSNGYCQVQASITVTNAGPHFLAAVYSGDANNAAGQSWPAAINVLAPPLTFQSVTAVAKTVKLTWNTLSNQVYQVQFSTNLTKPVWANLRGAILATNKTASTTDSSKNATRFYRVQTVP